MVRLVWLADSFDQRLPRQESKDETPFPRMMQKRCGLQLVVPAESLQQIKDLSWNVLLCTGTEGYRVLCLFHALHSVLLAAALVESRNCVYPSTGSYNHLGSTTTSRDSPGQRQHSLLKLALNIL